MLEKSGQKATEKCIAKLKQELQQTELAAAIEAAGTPNTVEAIGNSPDAHLGPNVFAPIEVYSITARALINTGSPVQCFPQYTKSGAPRPVCIL